MKLALSLIMSGFAVFLSATATVRAENTTFTQSIYPIDCVIDTVNTGSNAQQYILPQECAEQIPLLPSPATTSGGSRSVGQEYFSVQNMPGEPVIPIRENNTFQINSPGFALKVALSSILSFAITLFLFMCFRIVFGRIL